MFDAIGRLLLPILVALYNWFGNLGVAIIIFTILTRVLILPLTLKQLRSQKKTMLLQPKIRELQRKYGKDREKLTQETMKLYQQHGANPVSGCLPLIITLPILFGVWRAISQFQGAVTAEAFPFLWIPSLTPNAAAGLSGHDPYYILPILSVIFQYIVQLMAMPRQTDPNQAQMQRVMLFMPLMFGWFAFTIPAGAVLYMITGSVIAMIQQFFTTGLGVLPKYLPFLPERTGFLTPVPVEETPSEDEPDVPEVQRRDFWTVLSKLQEPLPDAVGATSGGDVAMEQALSDVHDQINTAKKKRR